MSHAHKRLGKRRSISLSLSVFLLLPRNDPSGLHNQKHTTHSPTLRSPFSFRFPREVFHQHKIQTRRAWTINIRSRSSLWSLYLTFSFCASFCRIYTSVVNPFPHSVHDVEKFCGPPLHPLSFPQFNGNAETATTQQRQPFSEKDDVGDTLRHVCCLFLVIHNIYTYFVSWSLIFIQKVGGDWEKGML